MKKSAFHISIASPWSCDQQWCLAIRCRRAPWWHRGHTVVKSAGMKGGVEWRTGPPKDVLYQSWTCRSQGKCPRRQTDRQERWSVVTKWPASRWIGSVEELETRPAAIKPRASHYRSHGGEMMEWKAEALDSLPWKNRLNQMNTGSDLKAGFGETRQGWPHLEFPERLDTILTAKIIIIIIIIIITLI